MDARKEAKKVLQNYMNEFHVAFRDPQEAEKLVLLGFMAGYEQGLNFIPKLRESMNCKTCNGTGKEICNNPDHGFITMMGGEIGRLGCPACGHNEDHAINNTICPDCKGTGKKED